MFCHISGNPSDAAPHGANVGASDNTPVYTVEPGTIKRVRELLDSNGAEAVLYLPASFLKRREGHIVDSNTTLPLGADCFVLDQDETLITAHSAKEGPTKCIGPVVLATNDGRVTSAIMTFFPTEEDLDGRSVKGYMESYKGRVALNPNEDQRLSWGLTTEGKSAKTLLGNGFHPRLVIRAHLGPDESGASTEVWAGLSAAGLDRLMERLEAGPVSGTVIVPDDPQTTLRSEVHVPHTDNGVSQQVVLQEDTAEASSCVVDVTVLRPGWTSVET